MKLLHTFAFAATALIAVPANAAVIAVSQIAADWTNIQPASVVGLTFVDLPGSPAGNEEFLWGVPQTGSTLQSRFRFQASAPPAMSVVVSQIFNVGTFTFTNAPLANTPPYTSNVGPDASITSATLSLTLTLSVDGGASVALGPLEFDFAYSEQLVGSVQDDLVTIANHVSAPTFQIGSELYTLFLSGFLVGNNTFVQGDLPANEGQTATAFIRGFFDVTTLAPPNPEVPEPLSITLWGGLGLAFIAAARRRSVRRS